MTLAEFLIIDEQIAQADGLMSWQEFMDKHMEDSYEDEQIEWERRQEERFALWLHFPGDRSGVYEPEPFPHYL